MSHSPPKGYPIRPAKPLIGVRGNGEEHLLSNGQQFRTPKCREDAYAKDNSNKLKDT